MAEPGRQLPPPPPPPPPPTTVAPIVCGTPKVLAGGQRPSANRQYVGGVSAAQPPQRHPFAGVHPETLQHAAASLRKTQYREPLLAREIDALGRGPNELSDRRYWADCAQHAPVAQHPPGAAVHAPPAGAPQSRPFRVDVQHTDPLTVRINNNNNGGNDNDNNNNAFGSRYGIGSPSFSSYSTYRTTQLNNNNVYATTQTTTNNDYNNNMVRNNNGNSTAVTRQIPINRISTAPTQYGTNINYSTAVYGQNISQSSHHITTKTTTTSSTSNRFGENVAPSGTTPIHDPHSHIRDYAMNTPAASLLVRQQPQQQQPRVGTSSVSSATSSSSTNVGHRDFVRELRDSSLTERQKYSNQLQKSLLDGDRPSVNGSLNSISPLRPPQSSTTSSGAYASVDALITDMERRLSTGDVCTKCGQQIIGDTPGVTALGNAFHVTCFTCDVCHKQLAGCSFYSVNGQNLCQVDYMNSLEKCEKCATPITQKILRATGKTFHPECFTCPSCSKSLDGIPFTVDKQNQAFCLDCYHEHFSSRCAACLKAIVPIGNETEVARVIAMYRSYHVDCYKCEDCGLRLNSKIEGQGCYPLESHLLCKNCNLKRLKNTYKPSTATA